MTAYRAGGAAALSPGRQDSTEVAAITSMLGARELSPEWATLHGRSGTTNPYTHPSWMLTWAEHFVGDGNLLLITVRRGGVLVGVAPFYWVRLPRPWRGAFRALHLLGNGRAAQFTEIPGILASQPEYRAVFKATVAFLQGEVPAWDWVKLTIDAQQGWFEPQWLTKNTKAHSSFSVFGTTRACVVVDLPDSWEQFLAARKKKVRANIHRGYRSLDQRDPDWSVDVVSCGSELTGALDRIIEMHATRSERTDKRRHPTMFGHDSARAFYREGIVAMATCGQAEVSVLRCQGEIVAGLVSMRANSQVHTNATGANPSVWPIGPGRIMIAELARREIALGTAGLNLGAGPNESKLGWSERLEFNHDFEIIGPTAANRARFRVYSQISNLAATTRAARYDTYEQPRSVRPGVGA
jgi:CelD/BcsL family acetyltransferase involved in cellulose biosynthesis